MEISFADILAAIVLVSIFTLEMFKVISWDQGLPIILLVLNAYGMKIAFVEGLKKAEVK